MVYFPVPTNAPPTQVAHIIRGPAKSTTKPLPPQAVVVPKSFTPPPEELKKLAEKTSIHQPPPDEVIEAGVPSLPSMTAMAKNVLGSLGRVVQAVATGQNVRLGKAAAEARLAICKVCPFFRHVDERCSKCGCYMAVKTYLRAEKCPVGKW